MIDPAVPQCILIVGTQHLLMPQEDAFDLFRKLRNATALDSHYGAKYTVDTTKAELRIASLSPTALAAILLAE